MPKLAPLICLAYMISNLDTPVINVNVIRCNSSKISTHYILHTVKIGHDQYKNGNIRVQLDNTSNICNPNPFENHKSNSNLFQNFFVISKNKIWNTTITF